LPRRGWPLLAAIILLLGAVAAVHSYSQAVVASPAQIEISSANDLVGTPVLAQAVVLTVQDAAYGPSSVATAVYVQNNMADAITATSVSSGNPDVDVSLGPTTIAPGSTGTVPLTFSAATGALAGTSVVAPLTFDFSYAGGRVEIAENVDVSLQAGDPGSSDPQGDTGPSVDPNAAAFVDVGP